MIRRIREIGNWLKALFRNDDLRSEAELEMEQHLEFMTDDFISQGMSPKEARRAAMRKFGNVECLKEDCRASWGVRMVDEMMSDFRYAFRQIAKHKVHTAIIVLTLAICMGSNTTAYNLVKKLVNDPYEYVEEERIVQVGQVWTKFLGNSVNQVTIPHYEFLKEQCSSFTDIGFIDDEVLFDLDLDGRVRRISTDEITPEVWRVTGVQPIAGQVFDQELVSQTDGKVIVLGESLWRELGGSEKDLIEQDLILDGQSYRIIGVMPRSFYLGFTRVDAWIPRVFAPWELNPDQRRNHSFLGIAKLKPNVSVEQANQSLRAVHESFMELYPEDRDDQERTGATFGAVNINRAIMQNTGQVEIAFKSIQIVTLIVLIIGCLNVGGMILVKGYSRIQELAMRKAMGASVYRLVIQIYVEILAYFLLGGLCSLIVLKIGFRATEWLQMDQIPWAGEWTVDADSLLVTVAIALGAALLTGIMPVVSILRRNLMEFIKSGNRTMAGSVSKHRLHASFVIAQVSLSVILLIGAGVAVRNLNALLQKDTGFEREGRIAFTIPQPGYRFQWGEENYKAKVLPYQERMLERIRSMPGVVNASASNRIPISLDNQGHSSFSMHHYEYAKGEARASALRMVIRPGYFETVGTKLLLGRGFEETDTFDTEPVVIISQNTMERYYQGLNPVGMSIKFWGKDLKIVGVAEQVQDKPYFLEWNDYTLYFPFKQWHNMASGHTVYVVHVVSDPIAEMPSIERALLELDPNATITTTMFEEVFRVATFAQELPMIMTVMFASLALFLSGLGLYGLISFTVVERTKEYGIRMALGAKPFLILKRVLNGSGRLTVWGLLVGLGVSMVICSQLNPVLADVNTMHPATFLAVIGFVVAICVFASFFPAQRAMRINITQTLQY